MEIRLSEPPVGSRIHARLQTHQATIDLPAAGLRGGVWKVFAFALPFLGLPALAGMPASALPFLLLLQVIGLGILGFGIFAASVRQVIREDGDRIEFDTVLFGRRIHSRFVPKHEIVGVDVRGSAARNSAALHLSVHVDTKSSGAIVLGTTFPRPSLDWLCETLVVLATR